MHNGLGYQGDEFQPIKQDTGRFYVCKVKPAGSDNYVLSRMGSVNDLCNYYLFYTGSRLHWNKS